MRIQDLLDDIHAAMQQTRWDDAEAACRRALRADPKNGDAMAMSGILASRRGDDAAAVDWMAKAIKQLPRRWDLYFNAALILRRIGRFDDAELRLRKALMLRPQTSEVHYQLACVLTAKGQADEALPHYEQAVELSPNHAESRLALAEALHERQRVDEAKSQYIEALTLDDRLANAWFGLGHIRLSAGDHVRAVDCFRHCVELDEDLLRGWFGLGCAELARNDNVAAEAAFRQCLDLEEDYAEAHQNIGQSLFKLGDVDEALYHFRQAAALAGDDAEGRRLKELALRSIAVAIPGSPHADHDAVRDARAAWGAMQQATPVAAPRRNRAAGERLRIGYVSDFFGRDNWMKPVWGLVNRHDRSRFHVHLFHDGDFYQRAGDGDGKGNGNGDGANDESAVTPTEPLPPTAYRPAPDDVVCDLTGLDNDAAAARIAEHGIDILVDLNGYSRMDRLAVFARRPAPVIAAWFNMFATTGVPWFDYLIGDRHVIRADEEPLYTERVVRVDGSYLTFSVDYPVPDVEPPPCVERGYVTFGCFASQYKITDVVLEAWAQILHRVPTARLLLKNADLGVPSHQEYFREKLASWDVDPDRLTCSGPQRHFAFLEAYREIDVALDTFPYNGGTTTTEAIWQGVPVVTFDGDRWASRTSATLLREAGLGDWVANDLEGYIDTAATWGNAPQAAPRLADLRHGMREALRQAPVCDTAALAKSMEARYEQMWADHLAAE